MKEGAIKFITIEIMRQNVLLDRWKKQLELVRMKRVDKETEANILQSIEEKEYSIISLCKARDILYFDDFFRDEVNSQQHFKKP